MLILRFQSISLGIWGKQGGGRKKGKKHKIIGFFALYLVFVFENCDIIGKVIWNC